MLLSDPTPAARDDNFEALAPFALGSEEPVELSATLDGALPAWLKGALVRTAPALFRTDGWRADHWFDGLGMLYAFRVAPDAVRYQQRLLESSTTGQLRRGNYKPGGFATKTTRSFLRRIFEPVPEIPDNANVNVLAMGDELVAMTESTRQLSIDRASLAVRGEVAYTDRLGALMMSAHPHWDVARNKVVNVGTRFGAKSEIVIYEHDVATRARTVVGGFRPSRLPYVHAFGLSTKSAVIIGHPLTVNPLSLLWSNKGFIDHFRWRAAEGTRLVVIDRATGAVREHVTEAMFVFHVIHTFDDGDDTVLDVVAHDDASIVDNLRRSALAARLPVVAPKPIRLRINARGVTKESLGDVGFEFPVVHYKRASGAKYRFAWGTSLAGGDWASSIHRLDTVTGRTTTFHEPGWTFGEPVFVAEPGGEREGQGVIIAVGTDGKRSTMLTLDAESLAVHAWAHVPTAIPLGFHGSFVR